VPCNNGLKYFNVFGPCEDHKAEMRSVVTLKLPVRIEHIHMPEALQGKYQYFTEAKLEKCRRVGYTAPFFSTEDAIADYERTCLSKLQVA
jgi:hypothetical protein